MNLKDHDLLAKLKECLGAERRVLAEFLRHLMEVDRRRLYAGQGFPSLYAYLVEGLGLSEDTAYRRIQVARAARDYSEVIPAIERGDIHLTGMSLLVPVLTFENWKRVFAAAKGKSRKQIESLISELSSAMLRVPQADVIRRLPVQAVPKSTLIDQGKVDNSPTRVDNFSAPQIQPPRRVSIHFLADEEFLKCLDRARLLMKNKFPEGRLEDVFQEALRLYLEKKDPELKLPAKPFTEVSASRYIPTAVRQAVWKRDQGQCTFTTPEGKRCEARAGIEFDHKIPWAQGGLSTEKNLRLLCRTHNQHEARNAFGADWVEKKIREVAAKAVAAD